MTAAAALMLAGACAACPPRPAHRVGTLKALTARPNPAWIPAAVGAVVLAAFILGRPGLVIALSLACATAVRVFSARRTTRLALARSRAAAEFIGHLAEGVGAGSTMADAAARAAERTPPEVPHDLRRDIAHLTAAARRGDTPADLTTPELARVARLWELSMSRGVPIAGLLAAARDDIDHRLRHRAATDAALAGPKTTAVVLALLPLAGIAMGAAMGANPLAFLTGPGIGSALLVAGTALVCAGVTVSGEIIRRAAA